VAKSTTGRSEVVVFLGQREVLGLVHLLLVGVEDGLIDRHLRWGEGRGGDELEALVADELSGEPAVLVREISAGKSDLQERLLEVVVGLGRDVVVLQVLLPVEGDGLGLDFALLDIDLVAAEDDGDVFAHADEIACRVSGDQRGEAGGVRCQLGTFL
jgi:hypothetical protein